MKRRLREENKEQEDVLKFFSKYTGHPYKDIRDFAKSIAEEFGYDPDDEKDVDTLVNDLNNGGWKGLYDKLQKDKVIDFEAKDWMYDEIVKQANEQAWKDREYNDTFDAEYDEMNFDDLKGMKKNETIDTVACRLLKCWIAVGEKDKSKCVMIKPANHDICFCRIAESDGELATVAFANEQDIEDLAKVAKDKNMYNFSLSRNATDGDYKIKAGDFTYNIHMSRNGKGLIYQFYDLSQAEPTSEVDSVKDMKVMRGSSASASLATLIEESVTAAAVIYPDKLLLGNGVNIKEATNWVKDNIEIPKQNEQLIEGILTEWSKSIASCAKAIIGSKGISAIYKRGQDELDVDLSGATIFRLGLSHTDKRVEKLDDKLFTKLDKSVKSLSRDNINPCDIYFLVSGANIDTVDRFISWADTGRKSGARHVIGKEFMRAHNEKDEAYVARLQRDFGIKEKNAQVLAYELDRLNGATPIEFENETQKFVYAHNALMRAGILIGVSLKKADNPSVHFTGKMQTNSIKFDNEEDAVVCVKYDYNFNRATIKEWTAEASTKGTANGNSASAYIYFDIDNTHLSLPDQSRYPGRHILAIDMRNATGKPNGAASAEFEYAGLQARLGRATAYLHSDKKDNSGKSYIFEAEEKTCDMPGEPFSVVLNRLRNKSNAKGDVGDVIDGNDVIFANDMTPGDKLLLETLEKFSEATSGNIDLVPKDATVNKTTNKPVADTHKMLRYLTKLLAAGLHYQIKDASRDKDPSLEINFNRNIVEYFKVQ